jgi:lipid-A-disaccharide synthase
MEIFFSVGEPSGDQHAARLIAELRRRRPDLKISGYGGPLMEQQGCHLQFRLTDLAVMGFLRVVPLLLKFIRLAREAKRYFREARPDAVVLVDFPGFNWWIARYAKAHGITVFYYLPPQLWAWAPWRIRRMRRFVDHVLCSLPFEKQWYAQRGMSVDYVGHPFFDQVVEYPLDRCFMANCSKQGVINVGLLPGSRGHEVTRNWPLMIQIMGRLFRRRPEVRFLVACYSAAHRDLCEAMLAETATDLPVTLVVGKTPEIIEIADCCLMVSGSVSLEMVARKTPAAVIYRVGRLTKIVLRLMIPLNSITLPNLIAGRHILPEWVVSWSPNRDVASLSQRLDEWISDRSQLDSARSDLSELAERIAQPGATSRTAKLVLERLSPHAAQKAA